jgi:phage terminase small subunit
MPAKELTNKEQKFAKVAAAGGTQAAAYAAAYSDKGSPATQRANGHRIAKKPHVAAEIKRLRRLPAADDYAGIKRQMIELLLQIAENGSSVARHRAIVTLIKYADEGAVRQAAKAPIIEDLVRRLTADAELKSSEDQIPGVETIGTDDLENTLPFRVSSFEDDRGLIPDKPRLTRPVSAAEAEEAFRLARAEEIKTHQEVVRRSRAEVEKLTALYRQQQEAAVLPMSAPASEQGLVGEVCQYPGHAASEVTMVQEELAASQAPPAASGFGLVRKPGHFGKGGWVRVPSGG